MITVLVVVILLLLLLLLGAGTVVTVRRRDVDTPRRPPSPRRQAARPDAPTPGRLSGAPVTAPPHEAAPHPSTVRPGAASLPTTGDPDEVRPSGDIPDERPTHVPDALPEAKAPRVRDRVGRARAAFGAPLASIRRRGRVDEATFEELEEALLLADVGLATTERLLSPLRERVRSGAIESGPGALLDALRRDVLDLFTGEDRSLRRAESATTVWLFVGVNGVGKTTTIGKLAAFEQAAGRRVVLAAGDTFRAAAGEQLEEWAARSSSAIVRGADGADPSSVVFDAVQHAAARSVDLVLADTAGRLHTKVNLMEELRKVRRIADRPPGHVSEVLLVLDATTGQNGLVQARQFTEAVGVTGVVLTKLDGTAKGGVVLAIRAELGLPIKLVGLGEGIEDLVEFDPEEFVNALFE